MRLNMKRMMAVTTCLMCTCLLAYAGNKNTDDNGRTMSLAGQWSVTIDGNSAERTIELPGTIDSNGLGFAPTDTTETTHLTRISSYKGKATYTRDINIPKSWKKKPLQLLLERTKPTWVYVDGVLIDSCNNISTPHRFRLPAMKAGKHRLTVVVDNSRGVPGQIYASSHAYTEDTQTNWNGIVGRMELGIIGDKQQNSLDVQAQNNLRSWDTSTFRIEGSHFTMNGHKIFLRGKHDAAVWPLTGYAPADFDSWLDYFLTLSDYGINHVRFHSWCPPEAAFAAADSVHIFLQPELPFWGSFDAKDSTLMAFLHKEAVNILREYGHHPSFRMMALGNELWGSVEKMKEFIDDFRQIAPDKYYTFGSNYYLGYQGIKPGMDYFTTCRIGGEGWGNYNTHTRGSFSFADAYDGGMINHFYPNTNLNFDEACDKAGVPIISHETGQFQTYPDYDEMKKYTGVLRPYNFEVFRRRLANAGMLSQAKDFHEASGLWSVQLYKADIEMDLRTRNMAGFQLLDLQDYPGQGSAFVGILDAFMDSKHLVTVREWRQWCSEVVPLLVADRFCWQAGDTLRASLQIANYGESSLKGKTLYWQLAGKEGTLNIPDGEGLIDVGSITYPVNVDHAVKQTLLIGIDGTDYHNTYDLWFYPRARIYNKGVVVTHELTPDIACQLEQGANVLWMPDSLPHTVDGLFQTDYWNYRMFKTICENNKKTVSPGTLGILTRPDHPIFNSFPTEKHTNWQWFDVVKNSHPLVLDNFPVDYLPVVQVIDNVERNHKLGLVMEWQVGKGKLLVCMSNLDKVVAAGHPEGSAFYESVLNYMRSSEFRPTSSITVDQLQQLLSSEPRQAHLKQLNNISQY